jgi:transcriptional regulator with XRE-family HTH domain
VTDDPTARRRQLGRHLRKARELAKLTQHEVAKVLGCGQAKINKIESTLVAVRPDELEKLIELYQIPDDKAEELRRLADLDRRNAPPRGKGVGPWSAFTMLSDLEPVASEILCWYSERIPGPLQSESYMLHQHEPETLDSPKVLVLLRERRARAQLFELAEPPRYRVILSESALLRLPGGYSHDLMVDQIDHLLGLVGRFEHLELQILTFQAKVRYVDSDFVLLRFSDDQPDFAYQEYPGGARRHESRDEVNMFQQHWEVLQKAALSRAESEAFLVAQAKMDGPLPGHPK